MQRSAKIALFIFGAILAFAAGGWLYGQYGNTYASTFRIIQPLAILILCIVLISVAMRSRRPKPPGGAKKSE